MKLPNTENSSLDKCAQKVAAAIAAFKTEKVKQQKRREREDARAQAIVGRAVVDYASKFADFRLMINQVLQSAAFSDSDRAFLTKKGWL
jgi:hypothetical protein